MYQKEMSACIENDLRIAGEKRGAVPFGKSKLYNKASDKSGIITAAIHPTV